MSLSSQDKLDNAIYQTVCKDCIFSTWQGNTQKGCSADRLKNFDPIAVYDEEKEFYVINTICSYYRPKTWNNGVPSVTKALDECTPTVTIIFYIPDGNEDTRLKLCYYITNLHKSYALKKIQIILTHDEKLKPSHLGSITELLNSLGISYCGVSTFSFSPEYIREVEVFKKITGVLTYRVKNLDNYNLDYMDKINNTLNVEGKKVVFFDTDAGQYIMSVALKSFQYGSVDNFFEDFKQSSIKKGFYKKL